MTNREVCEGPPACGAGGQKLLQALAVFAIALGLRVLSWRDVFDGDRVVFVGNDAYYHARRAVYSAHNFPDALRVDPYLNFPQAGEPIWSPFFDGAAALVLRVVGAVFPDSVFATEAALAWIPPLLGSGAVVAVFLLTRRFFGLRAAWVAGLLLAVLPAHARYSAIGFLDHHAAVSLAAALLLTSAMGLLAACSRQPDAPGLLPRAAGLGAAIAASLLLWPGMLLHVSLVGVGLAAFLLGRSDPSQAARTGALFAGGLGVALVGVAPFCLGREWQIWGSFSPVVLSSFQPVLLAGAALGFGIYSMLCRVGGPLGRLRRGSMAALSALAVLGVLALWGGGAGAGLEDAWSWFAKREAFQSEVAESRSLLFARSGLDLGFAVTSLSRLVYLAPALVLASGWLAARGRVSAPRLLLVGWGAGLLVAALVQARFSNSFAVAFCPLIGWWIAKGGDLVADRTRGAPARAALTWAVSAAVLAFVLQPSLASYARDLRNQRRWLDGQPPELSRLDQRKRLLLEVARWIREHTPETAGYLDAKVAPEYALLSSWADGHVLEYVARRPTVVDNFGDDIGEENFALAERYYLVDEAEAMQILARLRARFVIAEHRRMRSRADFSPDAMISRLYFSDGGEGERAVTARGGRYREIEHPVAALRHHRLVFETGPKSYAAAERPGFKVYEVVAGALLEGLAAPGARVEARLALQTNRGRAIEFRSSALADPDGRYALRLPYATVGAPPSVLPAPYVSISSGAYRLEIAVREVDVREGRTLHVPTLR